MIQYFSELYINRKLNIGYYRTFDSNSKFDIIGDGNYAWSVPSISNPERIIDLDIRYNYEIIRDIYGVLISLYFKKVKE